MNRSEIAETVKEVISKKILIAESDIFETHSLFVDLNLTSLEQQELLLRIEEEFGVDLSEDREINTVGDIVDILIDKL